MRNREIFCVTKLQVERLRRQKKANKKRAREAELAEGRGGADVAANAAKKQRVQA